MRRIRMAVVACLSALVVAALAAAPSLAALADVPTPTISGPVPVTPSSHPFLASDIDLSKYGYVEDEYYVTGLASTYSGTGTATGTKVVTGGPNGNGTYPYKTRIVVRRPASAAAFNGTTVMEWYNVTAGFDVEWNWFNDPDYMMRHGYAWVGISAQRVGAQYLRTWNPARYGDLDVTSTAATDAMSYDIFGAVAKAVRGAGAGADPMGGLHTDRIVASGESQSGSRLNIYYNSIQPLHQVIDSFLITVAGGALRSDTPGTKAIRVLSERENLTPPAGGDPDTASYRRWDVAGGSHLPFKAYVNFAPSAGRDIGGGLTADCLRRPLSRVPWPYVYNRALDALVRWQRDGIAPANAPRQAFSGNAPARDAYGNGLGGIRLPEIEVPTATNTAVNSPTSAGGFSAFCTLLGSWEPFGDSLLQSLYGDYGDFVDKVAPKAQAVADAGFVAQDDVASLNRDASLFTRLRPTAPALTAGASPNAGQFELGWRGPPGPETQTTYELQHRSSAPGAAWETVPGAGALSPRSLAFGAGAPEAEGTYSYRVRSTTVVPALYPDPERIDTSPFSALLEGVKVDRSAPNAPIVTADRLPDYAGGGGWFKDTVTVSFAAAGDPDLADGSAGSGVDAASIPAAVTKSASGSHVVSGTVRDRAGNESAAGSATVQVDATAPSVGVSCPAAVLLGAAATATVGASDAESGLAADPSGTRVLATGAVGPVITSATATDNVGHTTSESCTTAVRYLFGGLDQPVNPDGSSVFKLGSTVPLKFRLTDAGSAGVRGAVARIEVAKVSNAVEGTFAEAESTSAATSGNLFRESGAGDYVFNLSTKGLSSGTWSLKVVLDDGAEYRTRISLR